MENNFFEKLPKSEVENILKKKQFERSQLTVNTLRGPVVVKIDIVISDNDKFGRVRILPSEVYPLRNEVCAVSFRIGTRVYFFKGKIEMDDMGFFMDMGFDLIELRRRRHIRFEVPSEYPYQCYVHPSDNEDAKVQAKIINFSESGLRIAVETDLISFQKGNEIALSLKSGNRATFFIGAVIRFTGRRLKENPELGLEFLDVDDTKNYRRLDVCEDLSRLIVQAKKRQKN
ncbi:MAG: PilZ domain-containing protein [Pseudobdellovibrio sp.]